MSVSNHYAFGISTGVVYGAAIQRFTTVMKTAKMQQVETRDSKRN